VQRKSLAHLRIAAAALSCVLLTTARGRADDLRLAAFTADITVPVGHALMGGGIAPAREIADPLYARGIVLLSAQDKPLVICALDWCQLNNDGYDAWRDGLAAAAGTTRQRVLLACVHQHDAPIYDPAAQRLLDGQGLPGAHCDVRVMHQALGRTRAALAKALAPGPGGLPRVTHVGVGRAEVREIASNRRVIGPDGKVRWPRNSATRNPEIRSAPVGNIDPVLKTISLWAGDRPLAAISCYAVHPMSYYGQGGVSADFPGLARSRRQQDDPSVFQLYFSGCSGDTTAGKYNDGAPENRPVLADRLYRAMVEAWKNTKRSPLERTDLRVAELNLPVRQTGEFEPARLKATLANPAEKPWTRVLAALGLSWQQRVAAGRPIDVPCLALGPARLLLLPGETFVEYQLIAQRLRPDSFVMAVCYVDGAPGYIPDARNAADGFGDSWCWVAPGADRAMVRAITAALDVPTTQGK
jgi:hypothetical protein